MASILSIVFPVFCAIAVGYAFGRFKKISLESLIEVLLYITIPSLVISSLTKRNFAISDVAVIAGAAVTVILGTGAISYVYLAIIKKRDLRGFYLPAMFMNSGNMSFPLALLAFGEEGLSIAVIYYITVSLLVYSLGIYIAKGGGGLGEMFRLPLIYASIIGLAINLTNVTLPNPLQVTVDMLGAATIPLMLISLGYRLHSAKLSHFWISLAGSIIRIGGGVSIAYLIVTFFAIQGLDAKIIILSSAMPSAVINFIISHRYNVHSDLVASTVVVSTLLSVVTTPLVLLWIM